MPVVASSAPPLLGTWIELNVQSCQSVTFAAPTHGSVYGIRFVSGAEIRLKLLTGTVHRAVSFSHDGGSGRIPLDSLEPKRGEPLSVVASEMVECPASIPAVVGLVYRHRCDVGPFSGVCLAPFQEVAPSILEPGWNVVEGSAR